jgi:hypothetical protein
MKRRTKKERKNRFCICLLGNRKQMMQYLCQDNDVPDEIRAKFPPPPRTYSPSVIPSAVILNEKYVKQYGLALTATRGCSSSVICGQYAANTHRNRSIWSDLAENRNNSRIFGEPPYT